MASFIDELQLVDGVNNLRNQFRQTFDCLDHLQLKLESQIDSVNSSSINPIKLSQRICSLQKILNNLQKRADGITHKKQKLIPKLINELTKSCINVHELRCKSGLKTSGIPENILSEFTDEAIKFNHHHHHENHNHNQQNIQQNESNINITNDDDNYDGDLSQDKFNKLPSSTKQRVTFDQLSETYELIKTFYFNQSKKQRKPIAIKILANNGVKLTGQTGTAIINCLRTLKLIQTSKQGIVCL